MRHRPTAFLRPLLAGLAALALAGCPSESQPPSRGGTASERVAPPGDGIARKVWLDPADAVDPEVWLASREAGHDVAADSAGAIRWKALLADADSRFGESDRMIANRAAQLEGMLAEIGARESAHDIVVRFLPLAAPGSRRGFSDLCQHYFNLRRQGATPEAALATLRAPAAEPGR
ncbi:hypothetical protein [Ancylobacter terrae]|uniref:hypothetical protein n=1 Tax=Ancylobacter sp. sgz301288 TaxID=3342077 RepID=UPI00385B3C04